MNDNIIRAALGATLLAASSFALAADPTTVPDRQQRMDQALQDYRGAHTNDRPGRFARGEASLKRGAHRAGHAVKTGADKTGHAIGTGARKTGNALRNTGDKMKDKTAQ